MPRVRSGYAVVCAYNPRTACRVRSLASGRRPKVLDQSKIGLAQRMHASGESATTIASMLGVSRATVYRVLAEQADDAN